MELVFTTRDENLVMMYSVKQVAEMLQIRSRTVSLWIDSGELDAIDVERRVIDFFARLKLVENGRRRLKISDVAEYLGVTEGHVRQFIAYGHLTAVNVGGTSHIDRYRICEKELYAFIERSRNEPKHKWATRLREPDFLDNLDKKLRTSKDAD